MDRTSVWTVRKPLVAVPVGQELAQGALEQLQLGLAQAIVVNPQQLHQEIDGGVDLYPHLEVFVDAITRYRHIRKLENHRFAHTRVLNDLVASW